MILMIHTVLIELSGSEWNIWKPGKCCGKNVEISDDRKAAQALELLLSEIPSYHVSLVFTQLYQLDKCFFVVHLVEVFWSWEKICGGD